MDFALTGLPLPLRIRPSVPMTDDELLHFCAKNDFVAIERDIDGEILIMSPSGTETSSNNSEINAELVLWNRRAGRGIAFDSNAGFTLPDGSMRSPTQPGYRSPGGNHSRRRTRHGSPRSALTS